MERKDVNNDTVEVNSEVAIVDLWSNSEVEFKCDHCIVLYKNETKQRLTVQGERHHEKERNGFGLEKSV